MSAPTISDKLTQVQQRIQQAAAEYQKNAADISLIAVSKRHASEAIIAAYHAGQREFGENYLQEALNKIQALSHSGQYSELCWHFIGPIQSNKTRAIAEHFDWVHTVDRLKIAQRLSTQRPSGLPPINICIQVNIDNEASKAGVRDTELAPLIQQLSQLPNITLRGLMAIPQPDSPQRHASLASMQQLFEQYRNMPALPHWDTLSMGMSADLEAAIQHGANCVRIGTDIFGPRPAT